MEPFTSYCTHCRKRTPSHFMDFPEDHECEEICAVCDRLKRVRRAHPTRTALRRIINHRRK